MIKNFLLLIIIAGSFGYSYYLWQKGPCGDVIEYRIDSFSEEFYISRGDFLEAVKEAEAIWETSVGRSFFEYKEDGGMAVNLIYDDRQATADRNEILEQKIDHVTDRADDVKEEFESLKRQHVTLEREYLAAVKNYESKLDSYNKDVEYWNSRGGAPEGQYEKLGRQADDLKVELSSIEQKRLVLNNLVSKINNLADDYNTLVKVANSNIEVINEGADKEFEQGQFVSDRNRWEVDIYEFKTRNDLVRVLAHEFGHALGVDHNENPESIMYYLNTGKSMVLSTEDVSDLKEVCRIK